MKLDKQTLVKWGIGLGAGLLVSPFILASIGGLIGLGVSAAILFLAVQFAPVFAMKVTNQKLKMVKKEAQKNPVETLQAIYLQKEKALQELKDRVTNFSTATKNFGSKVKSFQDKYPAKAREYAIQYDNMKQALEVQIQKVNQAQDAMVVFKDRIEESKAVWEMTQEAIAAQAAMGLPTGDPLEIFKAESAIDAVEKSVNQVMAELEMEIATSTGQTPKQTAAPALTNDPTPTYGGMFSSPKQKSEIVQR